MSVFINFVGRLGADAETITTGNTPFISCRVAVDDTVKKDAPQTRWITVNGNAETFKNVTKHLTKGKLVSVRGVERVSAYKSKSGEIGVDTRVWADGIEFIAIGSKRENENGGGSDEASTTADVKEDKNEEMSTGGIKPKKVAPKKVIKEEPVADPDDDLPF